MAGNAYLRVHEYRVQEFLEPGGEVNKLVHDVAILTKYFAQGHINNRTGTLGRMIQVNRPSRSAMFATTALVFTRTSYALYVHDGTSRIFAKSGKYLAVPRKKQGNPNTSGGTLRRAWINGKRRGVGGEKTYFTTRSVAGQAANPFLRKGLSEAMATIR